MRVLAQVVEDVSLPTTAQLRQMDRNGNLKEGDGRGGIGGGQDNEGEEEGPNCKKVFAQNMKHVMSILCTWDCGSLWVNLSEVLVRVID